MSIGEEIPAAELALLEAIARHRKGHIAIGRERCDACALLDELDRLRAELQRFARLPPSDIQTLTAEHSRLQDQIKRLEHEVDRLRRCFRVSD